MYVYIYIYVYIHKMYYYSSCGNTGAARRSNTAQNVRSRSEGGNNITGIPSKTPLRRRDRSKGKEKEKKKGSDKLPAQTSERERDAHTRQLSPAVSTHGVFGDQYAPASKSTLIRELEVQEGWESKKCDNNEAYDSPLPTPLLLLLHLFSSSSSSSFFSM